MLCLKKKVKKPPENKMLSCPLLLCLSWTVFHVDLWINTCTVHQRSILFQFLLVHSTSFPFFISFRNWYWKWNSVFFFTVMMLSISTFTISLFIICFWQLKPSPSLCLSCVAFHSSHRDKRSLLWRINTRQTS